jgi:D-glycero-beta-D-manno-heptose-7-phosphate kinase
MIAICQQNNIITTVDPKKDNFFAYKNVDLFKPNLKELKEGLEIEFDILDRPAFENAIDQLESTLMCKHTFITLSEHGVFIKSVNDKNYIPAHMRAITDVSGAGDTVITLATLCLTLGLEPKIVAEISNLAGGLVCEHSGVVTIDKTILIEEIKSKLNTYFS